jgi:hypothetical protein
LALTAGCGAALPGAELCKHNLMQVRLLAMFALPSILFAATPQNTVTDVATAVSTAVSANWNDEKLAKALHKLKLVEHLDQHIMEELESRFPGSKTSEELQRIHDESEGLKEPVDLPNFPSPQQPDYPERRRILLEAGKNALNYASSMPDFICTQTVRRYEAWVGRPVWELKDTLVNKLSYFDHVEDYKLVTVNGHATKLTYENLRGAVTEGEFASMLVNIFEPTAKTEFWWDHWTTLRNRPTHVFRFQIKQQNSHYRMDFGMEGLTRQSAVAGQHGFLYVDRDASRIVRIVAEADSLPSDFPVTSSSTVLDYDFIDISGRKFLLPLHADARMSTIQLRTRNVMDFTAYRKFAGESTITFEATDEKVTEKDKPPPAKK